MTPDWTAVALGGGLLALVAFFAWRWTRAQRKLGRAESRLERAEVDREESERVAESRARPLPDDRGMQRWLRRPPGR